jgi:hypothetical protein
MEDWQLSTYREGKYEKEDQRLKSKKIKKINSRFKCAKNSTATPQPTILSVNLL